MDVIGVSTWEDVPRDDNDDNPFGGIEAPDGLVFAPQDSSPELNWHAQQAPVPMLPARQRPQPFERRRAEPWKPSPDPTPRLANSGSSRALRMIRLSIIPLLIMVGLGYLVVQIMKAYGL